MNRILSVVFVAAIVSTSTLAERVEAAAAKATCLVCKVMRGEAEEEPVKAVRMYEGKEYGFCSEKCADAFVTDPVAYLPPVFPRPAPAFAVADLQGRALSKDTLLGKVVLLDFWATWCVPCRKAMPELQSLHQKYAERGFSVLGISIDEGSSSKVESFVKSKKITYPIAMDSPATPAWDAFRVRAVPAAFLIDREGRIVAQWTGAPPNGKELASKLEVLLRTD